MTNTQGFLERFNRWKNGAPIQELYNAGRPIAFDEGKDQEGGKENDPALRAALEYAISLKLDEFDEGKDKPMIDYIKEDSPLSYGKYYDVTGDPAIDAMLPRFTGGKNPDDELADMIIGFEGFLPTPKDIGDGKMTIGSGLTADKWVNKGRISQEENRQAVLSEIAERRARLRDTIPGFDGLPSSAQSALISYDYNFPITKKSSPKFLEAMRNQDYRAAAKQMDAGINMKGFSKGLAKRRRKEQNLFLKDLVAQPTIGEYLHADMQRDSKKYMSRTAAQDATYVAPRLTKAQLTPEIISYASRYQQGYRNLNLPIRGEVYNIINNLQNFWQDYKPALFQPTK